MKILFVSWDGPGTTYHESLFLPILAEARSDEDEILALQFTWDSLDRSKRIRQLAEQLGLGYEAYEIEGGNDFLRIGGTVVGGVRRIVTLVRRHDVDVILARSVIPALLVLVARCLLPGRRPRLVYDADGLPADERVEFGGWTRRSVRYWLFRAVERVATRRSSAVIVRSESAKEILLGRTGCEADKIVVVVNGSDPDRFATAESERLEARKLLGIPPDSFVTVYLGSLGEQYLPDLTFETFRAVEHEQPSNAYALVITATSNHAMVHRLAEAHALSRIVVLDATPAEVAKFLPCADLGIAYRAQTLSQSAVSPIKVAEYLLAGLPVAYTIATGDLSRLLNTTVALRTCGTYDAPDCVARWSTTQVHPDRSRLRLACLEFGRHNFGIAQSGIQYRRALSANL